MLGKNKERILVNLTKTKIEEIEDLAAKKGVSRNDIITMAIYAYLEEENDMLKLYKKYPEENLEMLFQMNHHGHNQIRKITFFLIKQNI